MKGIRLKNGVIFNVRGDKKKYYVITFAAETGYNSFYSKDIDLNLQLRFNI